MEIKNISVIAIVASYNEYCASTCNTFTTVNIATVCTVENSCLAIRVDDVGCVIKIHIYYTSLSIAIPCSYTCTDSVLDMNDIVLIYICRYI